MRALVVVGMLLASACGTTSGQVTAAAASAGVDLINCAPSAYEQFKSAVQFGGAGGINWVGVVLETLECAGSVYSDVVKALGLASLDERGVDLLAQAERATDAETTNPNAWSKRAIKRLARAKKIAERLQAPVKK